MANRTISSFYARLHVWAMFIVAAVILTACSDNYSVNVNFRAPSTPQGLTANAGSGIVTLSWDEVEEVDSYTIYWDTSPGINRLDNVLIVGATTNATHTGLTNGTTYYYRISAASNGVESSLSEEVSATPVGWQLVTTNPASSDLYDLSGSYTRLVAVGDGTIITSTDGDNWFTASLPVGIFTLNGVEWSPEYALFTAVGNSGAILTSNTGITWTNKTGITANPLMGVAWGDGLFVAVGANETIVLSYSPYFLAWEEPSGTVPGSTNTLNGVERGDGQFVAVGDNGFIISSDDANNWSGQASGIVNDLYDIAWGNDRYVAVGAAGTVLVSADGVLWEAQSSGVNTNLNSVYYNGSLFLASGDGGVILSSVDGLSWSAEAFVSATDLFAVGSDTTQSVVVGSGGSIYRRDN